MADKEETTKEEQAEVVYYYNSDENQALAGYPGVPPGNILKHQFEQYPKWIQNSIAESPMYKAAAPKKAPTGKESEK